MHCNEINAQIFARLNTIINDLYALGKSYTLTELVNKVSRSLTKGYQGKVRMIWEARDLSKHPLEKFMVSLMTYETMMRDHEKDEDKDKKKNTISLKSTTQQEEEEDEKLNGSKFDDIALLLRDTRNI